MSENQKAELSPQAKALEELMAGVSGTPSQLETIRDVSERMHSAASEPEDVTYREVNAGGVPGIWVEPAGADHRFVLIHSHAGGSVTTSAACDRKLVGHIAKAIGINALVLDFRRSPEHKYPAQVDDAETAFDWLVAEGYSPGNIISMGHSVGGFLALAMPLRLRDSGKELPGAIISISPWANVELTSPSIDTNADTDKLLSREVLEFFRACWIDGTDVTPDDVRINLSRSDLTGLPPTFVTWGGYELFADEAAELASRLHEAGVSTQSLAVPGGQHSYVWGAGRVPETDAAIAKLAAWARSTLPIGQAADSD